MIRLKRYNHYLLTACIILLLPNVSFSQTAQDRETAKQLVEIGDEIMRSTRAEDQARDSYEQAARLDPGNIKANYLAGYYRLHTVHKGQAAPFLEKVKELNDKYRFDIDYLIGQSHHYALEFDKAIEHYLLYEGRLSQQPNYRDEGYVSAVEVSKRIEECNRGKELLANPLKKDIINLGNRINSEYDDFAAVFNAAEDLVVFTSRRRDDNQNEDVDDDNMPYEDIYYSFLEGDQWQRAVNLGEDINTLFHESNLVLSDDGNELYIYKEINEGDIFVTKRNPKNDLWFDPVPMSENINTEEYSENSMTLSSDGNLIIYTSNKPGGRGGFDLYYSTKDRNGEWKKSQSLSDVLNTRFNEDGPHLDVDGKTLYFSSEGHNGMGGLDIYKSVYDSAGREWSTPENIGYPINSADNDVFYIPSRDGKTAFYASVKEDGYGFLDIYRIVDSKPEEPKEVEPEKVELKPVEVVISIVDKKTNAPLDATVNLSKKDDGLPVSLNKSDTGKYLVDLENEEMVTYVVEVEMPGYIFETRDINVPAMSEEVLEIDRIIALSKPVVNTRRVLRNIYFQFDKAVFLEESMNELTKLSNMMKDNPNITVEISGHTDNIGNAAYNKSLSQKRADAVRNYLIENGTAADRITAVGYGEERPLASNDDEREGRELNRRVEFKVTGN